MNTAIIYKDTWTPSRPWCADIVFSDGSTIKKWAHSYKSLKSIEQHAALFPHIHKIKRDKGMDK